MQQGCHYGYTVETFPPGVQAQIHTPSPHPFSRFQPARTWFPERNLHHPGRPSRPETLSPQCEAHS